LLMASGEINVEKLCFGTPHLCAFSRCIRCKLIDLGSTDDSLARSFLFFSRWNTTIKNRQNITATNFGPDIKRTNLHYHNI
jgi:hypothetical protein